MAIVALVVAVLVILSAVAFKKGYMTIEVVDEGVMDQKKNIDDYSI